MAPTPRQQRRPSGSGWAGFKPSPLEEPDIPASWTPETKAFVEAARVGRLATVGPDGSPHVVPICFAFDGTSFYSVIDQKPKRVEPAALRRVRNLTQNPSVSLVIDHYDEDWTKLGFVLVSGSADILSAEDWARAVALLRAKYPQYREMDLEGRPVIRIVPARVTAWGRLSPLPQGEG